MYVRVDKMWNRCVSLEENRKEYLEALNKAVNFFADILRQVVGFSVGKVDPVEGNIHIFCEAEVPSLKDMAKRVCRRKDPSECFRALPRDLQDEMFVIKHVEK